MSSWRCFRCRTVYPPGTEACPNCEEAAVAKASAEGGSTHYVAEGQAVPDDLPAGVRLVGPGVLVPGEDADIPDDGLDEDDDEGSDLEDGAEGDAEDYASQTILALRDLARDRGLPIRGSKAELVARLEQYDQAAA